MNNSEDWEADWEVGGSKEVRRMILSDSVSFTMFSSPRNVALKTKRLPSKTSVEDVSVDFVYNMRQGDGMNSIGWQGAGFLDGRLQYTGFARYDRNKGRTCAEQYDFMSREVKDTPAFKKAIREYYGRDFQEFQKAVESLPEDIRGIVEKLFLE